MSISQKQFTMHSFCSYKHPGCQEREFLSCERLYFSCIAFEVSVFRGYEAASLGKWFPKFRNNVAVTSSWM